MIVRVELSRMSVVKCVRHRGDDVCCSVVFGTLVGVFVFSVMWSELLMTSAINCPLWYSVYECHISCEDCDILYAVLYICVSCFVDVVPRGGI